MRVSVPRVQNLGKWPFLMGPNRTRTNCELRKPSLHPHFPAWHLLPYGRCSVCSAAWREGSGQSVAPEIFELGRDG